MARILGGGTFGEMRGKSGSIVFSRNKGGAYIRTLVKPTNPDTLAQRRARNAFATAVTGWSGLSIAIRQNYQNFATNVFQPQDAVNNGQYSGYQAYNSIRQQIVRANSTIGLNPVITPNPPGSPAVFTSVVFPLPSATPPVYPFSGQIANAAPSPGTGVEAFAMEMSNVVIHATSVWEATINFVGIGPSGLGQKEFIDPNGQKFGFKMQISNTLSSGQTFVNNPGLISLCATGIQTASATGLTGATSVLINQPAVVGVTAYKAFPHVGDKVRATLYAVSQYGIAIKIGSLTTTIVS